MSRQRRSRIQARIKRAQLLAEMQAEARTAWSAGQRGHGFEDFERILLQAKSMDFAVWEIVKQRRSDASDTTFDDQEWLDDEGRFMVAEIAAPHLLGPKGRLRANPREPAS